jgi:hypothetical protein
LLRAERSAICDRLRFRLVLIKVGMQRTGRDFALFGQESNGHSTRLQDNMFLNGMTAYALSGATR